MAADCPRCGTATIPATGPDGERLVLDKNPQMRGPDRYRVADFNTMTYERVAPDADVGAHPTHESTCPAAQRERERF